LLLVEIHQQELAAIGQFAGAGQPHPTGGAGDHQNVIS
jgi:hypothetical protein